MAYTAAVSLSFVPSHFTVVESTCWHYANGCTWEQPSSSNGSQWTLKMNGSGTSGALRLMNSSGEYIFLLVGVHNYRIWLDVLTDLKSDDTAVKIHPTYYAGGSRSGLSLVESIERSDSKGRKVSLKVTAHDGNYFRCEGHLTAVL
ncbi:Cytolysin/lectin [Crucibulum laeve]|uniref:Cytolysin/lectin n=1 Tax=Crucibulum laeve TaxID=68775 RepID=A0A5C3LST1_9AGAR|nr:Cytolysin/lectin [Crucibulum laeve]